MQKVRVDAHLEYTNFLKLLAYTSQNGLKNASQSINNILSEHFKTSDQAKTTADRLNSVIQQQNQKIMNLEFELKQKNAKVVKE